MPYLELDDGALYYESHGSGPPLLLIAGLASDSQSWLPVTTTLAERWRVLVFDNRGTGRTTAAATTAIDAMADDAVLLLDRLGIPSVHLLGHSMGGFVALSVAARHPQRVASLVLAATTLAVTPRTRLLFDDWSETRLEGGDLERWFRTIFYWVFTERFFRDQKQLAAALRGSVAYPYPQTAADFARQVAAINGFDGAALCPAVTVPTLVLAGARDLLFPLDESEAVAAACAGAQLRVLADAAHSLHVEAPAEFVRLVGDFLTDVAATR